MKLYFPGFILKYFYFYNDSKSEHLVLLPLIIIIFKKTPVNINQYDFTYIFFIFF